MTYKDLCNSVASLGFEKGISDSDAFLCAVHRAITTIYTEKEARSTLEIYQSAHLPSEIIPDFVHTGSGVEAFSLNVRAVCFKTDGIGEYLIHDDMEERRVSFGREEKVHKELLVGASTLSFVGDYTYSVFDIALYDVLFGPDKSDVPELNTYREYDLRKLCSDYLCPILNPCDEYGITIPNTFVFDGILKVPASYTGKIRLTYKRGPVLPSGDYDEPISLPSGCEHLLGLLCASYFWLDDDEEKASYYMSLYREGMLASRRFTRSALDTSYTDTNGWA